MTTQPMAPCSDSRCAGYPRHPGVCGAGAGDARREAIAEATAATLTDAAHLAGVLADRFSEGARYLRDERSADGGHLTPAPYQVSTARAFVSTLRALTAYTDATPDALEAMDAAVVSLREAARQR